MNIVGRTLSGLTGAVFETPPGQSPSQVAYLEDEADSLGNSLEQVAKSVVTNVTGYGAARDIVDSPQGLEG